MTFSFQNGVPVGWLEYQDQAMLIKLRRIVMQGCGKG